MSALRIAVIVGSNREGRFGPTVADWFAEQAAGFEGIDVDVIDVAAIPLPTVIDFGAAPDPHVTALGERLAAADAYVVVTPEYNHSFPAPLKNLIDLYRTQWQAKPVGFVSYGGMGGGLRAVEQLRLVFAELHATTVRDSVSFHNAWNHFDESGAPLDEGCNAAAKGMLGQLTWWARALRNARAVEPYAA
ncbi:NADPH-dependent FMN reductase [Prauserella alba]|uniref:NAD(P)H-dependent oxidoreductase n=1 Tax=Prauserella alba TaxID=176898 RepID=A0ABP4FVH2_9PSEU|nr:NAD(P)H-dependent oxidoreductase [Prauserella alba]MCP2181201.1 NAD(P)H-dependent FMN reductase [Prauserella alba]